MSVEHLPGSINGRPPHINLSGEEERLMTTPDRIQSPNEAAVVKDRQSKYGGSSYSSASPHHLQRGLCIVEPTIDHRRMNALDLTIESSGLGGHHYYCIAYQSWNE